MEFSSIIGLTSAIFIIFSIFFYGNTDLKIFDPISILIVFGGSFAVVVMRFNFKELWQAIKGLSVLFKKSNENPQELIIIILDILQKSRKEGFLALEKLSIKNEFLKDGLQYVIDGLDKQTIETIMTKRMLAEMSQRMRTQQVFKTFGEVAPAMGMIGTLVGLVQMLGNLQDPGAIGPAMAIAMLTTLYGAVFAHIIALPIAEKLSFRNHEETQKNSMILDALTGIQSRQNPRILYNLLRSYIPKNDIKHDRKSS